MIVKIKFNDDLTMMFGDSYKPWTMQFDEWFWRNKEQLTNPVSVEASHSAWIGWGGLKWCTESSFQNQLNREGCQDNEPDNLNPRQYNRMIFEKIPSITRKVNTIIKQYKGE